MMSIFTSPKTSLWGIVPGLILALMSVSGLWGGEIPVFNDDGTPKVTAPEPILDDSGEPVLNDDGTPRMTEGGEPVTRPAPAFDIKVFLAGLGLMGIGAAAGDGGNRNARI